MMNAAMTKKDLATLVGYTYRRMLDIDRGLPKDIKLFVIGEGDKYDLAIFVEHWVAYNVRLAQRTLQRDIDRAIRNRLSQKSLKQTICG